MDSKESLKTDEKIEWTVEEYAKDLDYFHNVIGLPKEGKIPKDITAEDVSAAALQDHFGLKDKKNGYKKEGIKGIPAKYIQRLTCALDGLEKFQPYTQEVARGLYYDCILKKPVNWAACGVDKHRGQLRLRYVRKTPPQFHLPPWKRVEHKFNAHVEDVETKRESEEENQTEETPSEVSKALDRVETMVKHTTSKQTGLEEEEVPLEHLPLKSVMVKPETKSEEEDWLASPKKLTPTKEEEAPKPESPMETAKMKVEVKIDVPTQVAHLMGEGSHLDHKSQDSQGIGEEEKMKDDSLGIQTGTRDGEAKLTAIEIWLQIVEDSHSKLYTSQKTAQEEFSSFTARMKNVTIELKEITGRLTALRAEKEKQEKAIAKLQVSLEEKVVHKGQLESDIVLLDASVSDNEDDPDGANDKRIRDDLQSQLLECCIEINKLQVAKTVEEAMYSSMRAEIQAKMMQLSEFDDQEFWGKSTLRSLEETTRQLTESYDFLNAECSLLKKHLDRGAIYVRPVPIFCPLPSEERTFAITECPVCSLGFFCYNWVPTPCGHCYHPSCLFPLLSPRGDGGAPKCVACSQAFHQSWLQCWGSSQADHHQIVELADEWQLEDQANSFKKSLTEFYDNNSLTIQGRRKLIETKHKKVTKSYSQDTVKASTTFHETMSRVEHVGLQCAAKSLGPAKKCADPTDGHIADPADGRSSGKRTCSARTADGKKMKVDLSIVKFEKGTTPSTTGVGSVVDDLQVVTEADWSKKRKCDTQGTASSAAKGKLRKSVDSSTEEAASESAKKTTPKTGRGGTGRGRTGRGGTGRGGTGGGTGRGGRGHGASRRL